MRLTWPNVVVLLWAGAIAFVLGLSFHKPPLDCDEYRIGPERRHVATYCEEVEK